MKSIYAIISISGIVGATLASCGGSTPQGNVIYQSDEFSVYTDSVCQGGYKAYAVSPYEIVTDYKSTEEGTISKLLHFRLSINSLSLIHI